MNNPILHFSVEVFIEPDEDGFHAYCPALKGLHVWGGNEEEALENAKDAAIAYVDSLIKHGDPIPLGIVKESEQAAHSDSYSKPHYHIKKFALIK